MVIEKKMNKLAEWAKGKPLGLVIIAQQAAVGAESCFEFLKSIKAGEKIEVLSYVPNVKRET
jgi:hypothetical protein